MRSERFINNVAKLRQSNLKCQATTSSAKCHRVFQMTGECTLYSAMYIQRNTNRTNESALALSSAHCSMNVYCLLDHHTKMRWCTLCTAFQFRLRIAKLFHHRDDFVMRIFFSFRFASLPIQSNWSKSWTLMAQHAKSPLRLLLCVFLFDGFQLNLLYSHNLLQLWTSFSFTGLYLLREKFMSPIEHYKHQIVRSKCKQ